MFLRCFSVSTSVGEEGTTFDEDWPKIGASAMDVPAPCSVELAPPAELGSDLIEAFSTAPVLVAESDVADAGTEVDAETGV